MVKKKEKKPIIKDDVFPLEFEEEQEADHVIDGYHDRRIFCKTNDYYCIDLCANKYYGCIHN